MFKKWYRYQKDNCFGDIHSWLFVRDFFCFKSASRHLAGCGIRNDEEDASEGTITRRLLSLVDFVLKRVQIQIFAIVLGEIIGTRCDDCLSLGEAITPTLPLCENTNKELHYTHFTNIYDTIILVYYCVTVIKW